MASWRNEAEAREQIKALVTEYYHEFKEKKAPYREGDRIKGGWCKSSSTS